MRPRPEPARPGPSGRRHHGHLRAAVQPRSLPRDHPRRAQPGRQDRDQPVRRPGAPSAIGSGRAGRRASAGRGTAGAAGRARILAPRGPGSQRAPRARGRLRATTCGRWTSSPNAAPVTGERIEILLELAASHERTGRSDLAAQRYREAADVSRMAADAMGLARAALGIQTLGYRSGAQNAELLELLREASRRLEAAGGPVALQSRVLAALARTLRHGTDQRPGAEIIGVAGRGRAAGGGRGGRRAPWPRPSWPCTTRCGLRAPPPAACPSSPRYSTPRRPAATTISRPRRTCCAPRPCWNSGTRPAGTSCSPMSPWPASWVMPGAAGEP